MKKLGLALNLGVVTLLLCSSLAYADSDQNTEGGVVHTIPIITVYGRAPKPSVVIELSRPTAAHEAGSAHEYLRERLTAQSIPPGLRPQR
jgi:hypothetical protein